MDSFQFNKMAGAVLGTALIVFGLHELKGVVYGVEHPEKAGIKIEAAEGGEATGGEAAGGETPAAESLGALLAKADAKKGEAGVKQCASCHDFTKGGPNKTGPGLYGIVMRKHASHEGFNYSDGMKAKAGDDWTYEALNAFLTLPKDAVPGTKMSFSGIKKEQVRADILAYLATLSDAPVPFPAP